MREKRTSLDDIAKAVGVSKATVSFVLNGKGDEFNISKKKQEIIREKAKEMAYVPNFYAKSLRQGKTKTIGVVLADITNPFYAQLCKSIQEELYKREYSTIIVNTNDDKGMEKTLMRELINRSIDGMIISPCNDISELIPILNDTHIPVVFADRPGDEFADFVGVSNEEEGRKLVEQFSSKPKKIALICPSETNVITIQERIQGITSQCAKNGIDCVSFSLLDEQVQIDKQISDAVGSGVDAIIALNNLVTFKVLSALHQNSIKIPEQVKLISFDDHDAFPYMAPPISALRQPISSIGLESVDRLVERLKESQVPGKHSLLSCTFIPRSSH
jgi:LacI family transcriptional regulator